MGKRVITVESEDEIVIYRGDNLTQVMVDCREFWWRSGLVAGALMVALPIILFRLLLILAAR